MDDATSTLVSTAVSTVFASIVAVIVARRSDHSEQRRNISDQVATMIGLSMEYPYLEDDDICKDWPNPKIAHDEKQRYENYCCYVFNVLENIWTFNNGDRRKIREMLHVEELIWRHRCWWQDDAENVKGYKVGFRDLVKATILAKEREQDVNAQSNSNRSVQN